MVILISSLCFHCSVYVYYLYYIISMYFIYINYYYQYIFHPWSFDLKSLHYLCIPLDPRISLVLYGLLIEWKYL